MNHFDRETSLERVSPTEWRGSLSGAWNIGANPNGGYLLSVAMAAVREAVPHPDPVSVTTHFLRPGIADAPCEVVVEVLRSGRTLTTARASLRQGGKTSVEMLAAFGDLTMSAGTDSELAIARPALPPPERCVPRSGRAQGVGLGIAQRLEVRLDPDLAEPGEAGRAEMAGWIRFVDGRSPDTAALPLFADAFPPSPFGLLGMVGWVPTVELTVHVRRRPVPGWIQAQFVTRDLHMGRMIEDGLLWDSGGHLVAQSRQIGLVTRADAG